MTALFIAFSMISLPAYVAMFHPTNEAESETETETNADARIDDGPSFQPAIAAKELPTGESYWNKPISGLFQRAGLRRMM